MCFCVGMSGHVTAGMTVPHAMNAEIVIMVTTTTVTVTEAVQMFEQVLETSKKRNLSCWFWCLPSS